MAGRRSLDDWIGLIGSVAAPAGIVTALLFYFGYASTRAEFEYFGVEVDTVGLDTTGFLLRSPQPLFVPLLVIAVLALLVVWVQPVIHLAVQGRPEQGSAGARRRALLLRAARVVEFAGLAALVAGLALTVAGAWLRDWSLYAMVTPLGLMAGVLAAAAGRYVRIGALDPPEDPAHGSPGIRRTAWVLCAVIFAGSLFWAASTFAQWTGRGQAVTVAEHFSELPRVILDTRERLYIRGDVIEESSLPAAADQSFRYRYRNLRLLVEGNDRMFLVPERWTNSGTTLVVPLDGDVRVQFQFQNPG